MRYAGQDRTRAVYKDPEYLFLDEATNALDATNEALIMDNLRRFYIGRTVDIPHHRMIRSFNPIYRISRDTLSALDAYLKEGNEGHHEVLIPTFLDFAGFKISDFGGDGSFVEKGFAGSAYTCRGPLFSMRFRPPPLTHSVKK